MPSSNSTALFLPAPDGNVGTDFFQKSVVERSEQLDLPQFFDAQLLRNLDQAGLGVVRRPPVPILLEPANGGLARSPSSLIGNPSRLRAPAAHRSVELVGSTSR